MNFWSFLSVLVFIAIVSFLTIEFLKRKSNYKKTLNLTFLKITLPKKDSDLDEKKETAKDFKEQIGLMEQLYASLKAISSNKFMTRILGQDLISFEYVAHE
ncbi:MAG: hypothetical protein LBC61_06315 [Candidatus Peribacteria bacterium]|jgi:hypothetical protein|nr:hypothetical protein [Candidatus Peribacteria bacterium]